jgi:hypothetical protein
MATGAGVYREVLTSVDDRVYALTERNKWTRKNRKVQVGDLLLIVDQNAPRGTWLTGTVSRLLTTKTILPKKEQMVRTMLVKTATGEYQRPVVKLCMLRRAEDSSCWGWENVPDGRYYPATFFVGSREMKEQTSFDASCQFFCKKE